MTRRRLLQIGMGSSLVLLCGGGLCGIALTGYEMPPALVGKVRLFSAKQALTLLALCSRILHGTKDQVGPLLFDVVVFLDRYLSGMNQTMQADVRNLLHLFEHIPWAFGHGGRFSRLSPTAQDEVLRSFQESRIALFRQGFFAIKSLTYLAYYQDPRSFAEIGYSGPLV